MARFLREEIPSATRTATGNVELNDPWGQAKTIHAGLRVTAASGTSPSMTVTVQSTIDDTNWDTILTFTAATAATHERKSASIYDSTPVHWGNRLRVVWTITGTTPSFTFFINLTGKG